MLVVIGVTTSMTSCDVLLVTVLLICRGSWFSLAGTLSSHASGISRRSTVRLRSAIWTYLYTYHLLSMGAR